MGLHLYLKFKMLHILIIISNRAVFSMKCSNNSVSSIKKRSHEEDKI